MQTIQSVKREGRRIAPVGRREVAAMVSLPFLFACQPKLVGEVNALIRKAVRKLPLIVVGNQAKLR